MSRGERLLAGVLLVGVLLVVAAAFLGAGLAGVPLWPGRVVVALALLAAVVWMALEVARWRARRRYEAAMGQLPGPLVFDRPPLSDAEVAELAEKLRAGFAAYRRPQIIEPGPAPRFERIAGEDKGPVDLAGIVGAYHRLTGAQRWQVRRIELGERAERALRRHARPGPGDDQATPIVRMLGLPVVVDEQCPPGQWRIMGHDGDVVAEGEVGQLDPAHCRHACWFVFTSLDQVDREEICRDCGKTRRVPRIPERPTTTEEQTP